MPRVEAVLFDLDGTLLDTAPDLAHAANRLRGEWGLAPLPLGVLRPVASQGARGLLRVALGLGPDMAEFPPARERFLELYQDRICADTAPFPGMPDVLATLENQGIPWGIVTNKPTFLTTPLLAALGLGTRAAAVICGDSLPRSKPDPMPVRHALHRMGKDAPNAVLLGDDCRDIQSAHQADIGGWAAAWGYIEAGDDPERWGAERVLRTPAEILPALALR